MKRLYRAQGRLMNALMAVLLIAFITLLATPAESSDSSPQLIDGAVPSNLLPPLTKVVSDRPKPYYDRCHVQQNLTATSASCLYGDPHGSKVVILFGDSHALSWFSAVEKLAIVKKWKFYSLTMSSCWPADIAAFNSTTDELMTNCPIWRTNAINFIKDIHPYITFVAGTRGFSTVNESGIEAVGTERLGIWRDGIARTLTAITHGSRNTVYIGDTPNAIQDINQCLLKNARSIAKCASPRKVAVSPVWIDEERNQALNYGAQFVDPSPWICDTDRCSPISGRYLKYFDAGHFTATYMRLLEAPLWRAINRNLV